MNIIKIKPDINDLREYLQEAEDAASMQFVLGKHNLIPEYLYFIVDKENRRLTEQMIFTAVADLNLEGDLVVFESFNSQIYYLFRGSGECIQGPCHDLDLGYGGLIQFRNSGGEPVFQMKNLYDPEFHKIGGICPFEHFPYKTIKLLRT